MWTYAAAASPAVEADDRARCMVVHIKHAWHHEQWALQVTAAQQRVLLPGSVASSLQTPDPPLGSLMISSPCLQAEGWMLASSAPAAALMLHTPGKRAGRLPQCCLDGNGHSKQLVSCPPK